MRQAFIRSTPQKLNLLTKQFSTVSPSEVSKFSRIGSQWWDDEAISGASPLHSMNPTRVKFIVNAVGNSSSVTPLHGLRILDVGCGGGLLSETLARLGADVTAIDPSENNINVARRHSSFDPLTRKIQYLSSTIEELKNGLSPNERFDVICSLEVIEHVDQPGLFLKQCCESLRPGGSLIISTINRTPQSLLFAIVAAEYISGVVPKGTHDWRKFISPDELDAMVNATQLDLRATKKNGLSLEMPDPVKLLSSSLTAAVPQLQWKLSDCTDINYIAYYRKTENSP